MRQMPDLIYVLDKNGKALMPTRRKRHVAKMLDKGEAKIVSHVPYTIQLLRESTHYTHPLCFGTDPGRTNIGHSVVTISAEELYRSELETRNKDVTRLMGERKRHRQSSRRGERKRRQRRAKRHNTIIKGGVINRKLPGTEKTVTCKLIRNTEAKFNNRKRQKGWLTPTANHLVQTHINMLKKAEAILPITDVSIELNKFAFMELEDPEATGLDFQNGPLKGFLDIREALYQLQGGKCLLCGKKHKPEELHNHHIVPKEQYGSDTIGNRCLICNRCHDKVHKDVKAKERLKKKKEGITKKYGGTSVLNQAMPYIAKAMLERYGDHCHFTSGGKTCSTRKAMGIEKDRKTNPCHGIDAYIIACAGFEITPESLPEDTHVFHVKQYRRHNRARIDHEKARTYKLETKGADGKIILKKIAKNRKPATGQADDTESKENKTKKPHVPALSEWYAKRCREVGKKQAQKERSQVKVLRSTKSYNNDSREMPGAEYWYGGERHVLHGRSSKIYIYSVEQKSSDRVPESLCHISRKNKGLVYIS